MPNLINNSIINNRKRIHGSNKKKMFFLAWGYKLKPKKNFFFISWGVPIILKLIMNLNLDLTSKTFCNVLYLIYEIPIAKIKKKHLAYRRQAY